VAFVGLRGERQQHQGLHRRLAAVHDIFAAAGATNVRWVWAINSFAGRAHPGRRVERYYPGAAYVDWVSVTGFNWGPGIPERSVRQVFDNTLRALGRLRKPIMISEVGSVATRGNPGGWIGRTLKVLPRRHPRVRAIVWFDDFFDRHNDFRLRWRVAGGR
jgi:mannan endo-1,4-beta-mannosidase